MNQGPRILIAVLVVAGAGGGFLWWRQHHAKPPAPPAPTPVAAPAPPPVEPTPPPAAPPKPAIAHPIDTGGRDKLPSLDQSDSYIKERLFELAGRKATLAFLGLDGFLRHFVATVANLGTDHAPADMWPVRRTEGFLDTEARGDVIVIGAKNAERYAPFVAFVGGIDTGHVVALYRRLYPLLQEAYEELGYPGKYFNDRVVEVIDDLLAAPDVAGPIKLKRIEVPGALPGKVGGLYVFEDAKLEARTAGQKILLRVGHDNAVKLKAKLAEVRARIASGPGAPR